mmetsp:Transcript_398/g.533  ORF Transcript_398/g.533 Transcript_398/m.533 type:complete len:98 (+) Transcript_398:3-296(+)
MGGRKGAGGTGVDWKNRPAASLRLQLAASAKARKKAKGGSGTTQHKAKKKAGGNRKLAKGQKASKPTLTPAQLAHIKANKNKAKTTAKRMSGAGGEK